MRLSLLWLAVLETAVHAWDDCAFPKFDHFSIDEGAGKSWAYTATAMNDKTYLGGYALGHFGLQGVLENDEVPAANSAVLLGKTYSEDITLYVAEVSSEAKMEKAWYFTTDQIGPRDNKIAVRGLHHSLDKDHVIVMGYYNGTITLPDGIVYDASDRLFYGKAPVPFVVKLDVKGASSGVGPGTTGWFAEVDKIGAGFPGGAQVYSIDGFLNGDVLVSYGACMEFNSTDGAPSFWEGFSYEGGLGCKHYLSKLRAADGSEIWRKEMPSSFKVTGVVHGEPIFEEFEPCRVIQDGSFFCAFHLDVNETIKFNGVPETTPSLQPKIGVVKFDNSGDAVWAKATVVAGSVTSMSVNKDGTLLAVAGQDEAGSMRQGGGPALLARIDTTNLHEGEVLWTDAAGYGSHGIRDCMVTWDPEQTVQQVLGFGQITSTTTLTDSTGAKTTLNARGSYEVFLVSYNATDGSGKYAVDGGSEGLEYFFELAMDMDSSAIVMAGAVGSGAKNIEWGNVKRPNAMNCEDTSSPVGNYKAFFIKLKTETEIPACLDSCDSATGNLEVKAGHCYIDRYCYKHDEVPMYPSHACLKCDANADAVKWTGPDTTEHCFMPGRSPGSGTCVAEGAMKRGQDCMQCQPAVDSASYTLHADYQIVDKKCVALTWADKANDAGWVPCSIKAARLRRLAMKPPLAVGKADDNDD
jgi:hypothetical protein